MVEDVQMADPEGDRLFRELDERTARVDNLHKPRDDFDSMTDAELTEYLNNIVSMELNIYQAASLNKLLPKEFKLINDDEMDSNLKKFKKKLQKKAPPKPKAPKSKKGPVYNQPPQYYND
jgi:hypothetical protein